MIKINLAKKRSGKTASSTQPASAGIFSSATFGQSFESLGAGVDWRNSALVKVIVVVAALFLIRQGLEDLKGQKIAEVEGEIRAVEVQQEKVAQSLSKVKGFEPLKKQLEEDEHTIQTKLDIIAKLTLQRDGPARLMKQIAQMIPEEVWLNQMSLKDEGVQFVGGASSYNMVSDFMNGLASSSLLSDIALAQISEVQNEGIKYQSFEVSAKRRSQK